MVRIMDDNRAVTGQDLWEPICFCVKMWCHLPGLLPWGLAAAAAALVVGPGLFPDRLRRSSACACAAAAVCRKAHRHTQFTHRELQSHHAMTDKAGTAYQIISRKQNCFGYSKPIKFKSAVFACALFSIGMLVLERSNGFEATEQSSYSAIWHNPPLMVNPAASHTLLSVTSSEGWAAVRNMSGIKPFWASWYTANIPRSGPHFNITTP